MAPRSARVEGLFREIAKTTSRDAPVCLSCRHALSRRGYASLATAQATVESPPVSQVTDDGPAISPVTQPRILVKAGVVVSRAPLVTPDPHPFETAFHLYQRRLNERLVLPFMQYFYYRPGTPSWEHWKSKRTQRGGVATRDIGKYNAYTKESWNDEVVLGDDTGEPQKIVETLIEEEGRQAEYVGESGDPKMAGLKRTTQADAKNDQRSLERKLSRTLYLVVRNKAQTKDQPENMLWRFPSGAIEGKEGLKEAAQRVLDASCGVNMNTWFVANHPIGHYNQDLTGLRTITDTTKGGKQREKSEPETSTEVEVEKTFFMKARIFTGQADLKNSSSSLQDFKWLTKQEIEKIVTPGYWSRIKNMLVEQ